MNNHEDISKRRGGEDGGLPDNVNETLPIFMSSCTYESSPPRTNETRKRRRKGMLAFAVSVLLLSLGTLVFASLSSERTLVLPEDKPQEDTQTDEWRGAFVSREVYENALASAVSIRLGKQSNAKYCSGVVLGSDGLIATAIDDEAMLNAPMYVMPSGGGEYAVVSVELDRECGLALLKIPADALCEATVTEHIPQVGESVISISASQSGNGKTHLRSCNISSVNTDANSTFCFDIDREDIPAGSPIFDENGGLLAIVGEKNADTQAAAVSVARCKSCFKTLCEKDN